MRLRSHVLIIAAATLVPLLVFVCVVIVLLFQKGRDRQMQNLVETARALSLAVDRDFESRVATLKTLGTSEHLQSGDLRRFCQEAKRVLAVHEGTESIVLIDRSGQQIVNTRRPVGALLPRSGDPDFIRRVIESRKAAVSNLVTGAIVQRPLVIIGVPVSLGGEVKYVLTMGVSPQFLQNLLQSQNLPADSLATIIDANKIIIARTRDIEKFLGRPATPRFAAKSTENREGSWVGEPYQSERSYAAHHRSAFSSWTVGLAVPESRVNAALWETLKIALGGFIILLAVACGFALVFGRRIVSSIKALSDGAKTLGSGEVPRIDPSPIVELDQVRNELVSAAAQRKLTEDQLRYELELVQNITQSAAEAIFITDADGNVTFANPEAEKMFGFSMKDLAGQSLHQKIHPRYPDGRPFPRSECKLNEVHNLGQIVKNREDVFFRKDGSAVNVECSNAPVKVDGQGFGAVTIVRDITERKRLSEEVRVRAEQLVEADRRKDEFLATLAHELRNPLAPIINAVEILRLDGTLTPDSKWVTDVIDKQTKHMTRLIDDLLDISRITRNRLELRKEPVEVSRIVKMAVDTTRPLIEQFGHDLSIVVPPDPIYLDADPVRLAQVLSNLLNNAAKYTDRGGSITLAVKRTDDTVVVSVKDTGIGIPGNKLNDVFELFAQIDPSLERAHGGLGIGLNLARRLVEMHGGSIEAKSEGPGKGSQFTVRLPIVVDASRAEESLSDAAGLESSSQVSHRILVVDDNRDLTDTLGMMLRFSGNAIRTAHDGEAAVAAAEEFNPDIIILDLGLPKLNGYEACRRMRQQPGGKKRIIVAVTGWSREEDRRRTKEAGFDLHWVKPVNPAALTKLLAELEGKLPG